MELNIYQVDAFAMNVFEGNPAAVCPLEFWLPDDVLQNIAEENHLSETAFFVAEGGYFLLRWFTPEAEVDLCGHATLAAAHVIFEHLGYGRSSVVFNTRSGELVVHQSEFGYRMNFPATLPKTIEVPIVLKQALNVQPQEVMVGFDYLVVLKNESEVRAFSPDFMALSRLDLRGVVITAMGDEVDFVSRCFFPKLGVNEDPVTGSAHCELAPYWSQRLKKSSLTAMQLSKRTGLLRCEVAKDRVVIEGNAVDYLAGKIWVNP
ncbi:PhzF family phenazine biosynthesis protein [Echinimonas agarilytica]|uniref:PhzF family phenazine biosynthesis protein n=1 Tax=Echinimonas agarilytica TaxID=1215918 RepID=A0AA42B8F8_9GAMM|nr:PhzF family phenazine biosynthesis protein [Echinimonas agarilytica]MCM2680874.1 PhzF family phenazine biosynthesis protein [Echinimonas agarilytica]